MAPGKLLEQVIAALEFALATVHGTQIQRDVEVLDRDNITQQIDVLVVVPVGASRRIRIGIECRDYQDRVKKDAVHAFKTKCEDARIDKGVIVTRTGYQSGAVKKAKLYGIELLTLTDLNETTIRSWIGMEEVTVQLQRYRVQKIGIYSPEAPDAIVFDNCTVIDRVWNMTAKLREFATRLVEAEPPPFSDFKDGLRKWRHLPLDPGTVSLVWQGQEFPLLQINIEIEFFTEKHIGPRVRSGRLAEVETGDARGDVISFRVPILEDEVIMSFVQSADGIQRKVIVDGPAALMGENPVRQELLASMLGALKITSRHEALPCEPIEGDKPDDKKKKKRMEVVSASLTVGKQFEGEARVNLSRVYLADKRTGIGTGALMVYLLKESSPPLQDLPLKREKRIRSTLGLPENSVFAHSTGGFVSVTNIVSEIVYRA